MYTAYGFKDQDHPTIAVEVVWDEDPETNAQAPYFAAIGANSLFDAVLLARTADKPSGLWDRQSPFVIISDRTPEQIAQLLGG